LGRFNFIGIIKNHIETLYDIHHQKKKYNWWDIALCFVVPIPIAGSLSYKNIFLGTNITHIVTVFAIFTGLFLNLLILIFDLAKKVENIPEKLTGDKERKQEKLKLYQQTFHNMAFGVLVSILIVVFSLIYVFIKEIHIGNLIVSFIVYYLIWIILLTLFMVLKRFNTLVKSDLP
jgi:hypothetical protein